MVARDELEGKFFSHALLDEVAPSIFLVHHTIGEVTKCEVRVGPPAASAVSTPLVLVVLAP